MLLDCPFCGHEKAVLFRKSQDLKEEEGVKDIYKCEECGILYPKPRMDESETKQYLSRYFTNRDDFNFEDPIKPVGRTDAIVRMLKKQIKTKGAAMDIGSFDGRFCHTLSEIGFDAYGLEPQENAALFARSKGLKVYAGSFPEDMPDKLDAMKYSLVSIMETLYYMHDLKGVLQKIHSLLDDGGFLLLKCHQGNSRYYDKYSYFSRYGNNVQGIPTLDSLKYCLDKTGFQVVCVTGITSPDLLPFNINWLAPGILKRVVAKLYNMIMLQFTLLGIAKADRLVLLAKKGIRKNV